MTYPALGQTPALQVSEWLNAPTLTPITLDALRGQVVVLHAFQMLCPACVSHGLPQAQAIRNAFSEAEVVVLGLHTVFEHHAVMNVQALKVFVHEYGITFPVGIDEAGPGSHIPLTMQAYGLQGTPSLVVVDRQGRVRLRHFGLIDDLKLGAFIGRVVAWPEALPDGPCNDKVCAVR
jgi:peroxiredoxin